MSRSPLLAGALFALLLTMVAASVLLLRRQAAEKRLAARLLAVRRDAIDRPLPQHDPSSPGAAGLVLALGVMIARSGLLSQRTIAGLQQTLTVAGLRGTNALGWFVGAKLLMLAALPLIVAALLLPTLAPRLPPLLNNGAIGAAAVLGLLAPDWWVGRYRARHITAVAAGLPDALDMMVICAESGLGLQPALARVGHEIAHAHPAIAAELMQTVRELRMADDVGETLGNMAARTGLEGLKRVASVLAQTMKYGTPLGQALRVLSAEMRQEAMVRLEARAARLPVLLTLPMIVCILPCIFLIVIGPAIVQVINTSTQ